MSTPLSLLPHAAARRSNANLSNPADANGDEDNELDMELQSFFPRNTSVITSSNDPLPLADIHPAWKRTLHALLEHPNSSPSAFLIHITTTFLILLSAIVTILETIPAFHSTSASVWFGIETSLVVLFTVEYVARSLAWSVRWDTFLSWFFCKFHHQYLVFRYLTFELSAFFGIIDLLAILPYYVELLLGVDTVRMLFTLMSKLLINPSLVRYVPLLYPSNVPPPTCLPRIPDKQHNHAVRYLYLLLLSCNWLIHCLAR